MSEVLLKSLARRRQTPCSCVFTFNWFGFSLSRVYRKLLLFLRLVVTRYTLERQKVWGHLGVAL